MLKRFRYTILAVPALFAGFILALTLNPSSAANDCGGVLPYEGAISGTYDLTGDCTLTNQLSLAGDVTINGHGHTIEGDGTFVLFFTNWGASNLTLNNLTLRKGFASGSGGAIDHPSSGLVTVNNVFVTNNKSNYSGGAFYGSGDFMISNSTFTGNEANENGGAIGAFGSLTITNSTFSGNTGGSGFDAVYHISGGTITASIFVGDGCGGALTDGGNNIAFNSADCPGDNVDPLLGSLTNGYFPLLEGSPAIDAYACTGTDQRGIARPQGSACDIGAVEMEIVVVVDPETGEEEEFVVQPEAPAPALNDWQGDDAEEPAQGYGMPESVYGTVHMWEGAWQYNPGGIPQELVDYGVIVAVDVWVLSADGTAQFDLGGYQQICLLGEGRMVFMDATQSPRPMVEIEPVEFIDGYTCGWIPNAGTVVLIGMEPQ